MTTDLQTRIENLKRALQLIADGHEAMLATIPETQRRYQIDWAQGQIFSLRAKLAELERQLIEQSS